MTNNSDSNPAAATHHNVVPSEVGWQFVPQYYTFVNKQPGRLHCFYTKSSTFIHGTEGEEGKPCFGQQEIHNKITSIGFEDCKVFIHSVDAQSSANGGIIIQVIGEMSNHGDPWRKFVQTFFLAEQPNGYFVLNDIFRFLKEETIEGDDDAVSEPEVEAVVTPEAVSESLPSPAPVPAPEPISAPPSPVPVEEPVPEPVIPNPAPEPTPQKVNGSNGVHAATPEPETAPAATPVERSPSPEPAPAPAAAAPTPAPAPRQATAPPQLTAASAPPQPAAPPAPKTWANLAATNPKKWGNAVATESKGVTEVLAVPAGSSQPRSSTPQPASAPGPGSRTGAGGPHPALQAAQGITTAQCFVKGVVETVSQTQLLQVLTQRFGPVKEGAEVVRSKACAFLEFTTIDAAKRAIIVSLPVPQGGEGGIRIDLGGEAGQVRIVVETRKERGDRPVSRPRGGSPANGESRGSFRGRGSGAPRGGGQRGATPAPK